MAVINIPPNGRIYGLGKVPGTMHVYCTGMTGSPTTTYGLAILSDDAWDGLQIDSGHTDTYHPNGRTVVIQNTGPSKLQVLYVEALAVSPEEAGLEVLESMPALI